MFEVITAPRLRTVLNVHNVMYLFGFIFIFCVTLIFPPTLTDLFLRAALITHGLKLFVQ